MVDAKTPLDAYLSAIEAPDLETRSKFLEQHAKVRERVWELAAKAYWDQFQNAPDFVVLFIPGEQFLGAALDVDRGSVRRRTAAENHPRHARQLRRAAAYRGLRLASGGTGRKRAGKIRSVGEELYARLSVFSEHLTKLGKSLSMAVGDYNKAIGSYETKLLPGARKFADMGVGGNRALEPPEQVDKALRDIQQG